MPFLLFDFKNTVSFDLSPSASKHLIAYVTDNYPAYVKNIPCIYDDESRQTYNGRDECIKYLAQFESHSQVVEEIIPIVESKPVEDNVAEVEVPSVESKPVEENVAEIEVPSVEIKSAEENVAEVQAPKKKPGRRKKVVV